MKAHMLSKEKASYLWDHILAGFEKTHKGIEQLKSNPELYHVTDAEITEFMEKNSEQLIARIREFKAMMNLTCWVFAMLFTVLQVKGEDLDMRRPGRGGRRRDTELTITI
jgi:hypothetical protein